MDIQGDACDEDDGDADDEEEEDDGEDEEENDEGDDDDDEVGRAGVQKEAGTPKRLSRLSLLLLYC